MLCPVCSQKLTYAVVPLLDKACAACQRHIRQMVAGFHGVMAESRPLKNTWDNTGGYTEWVGKLTEADSAPGPLKKKDDYVVQRCDIRDMKRIVGLPVFLPLEQQVYTAWIMEGVKNEMMQEVLGLTYSQLFHVKSVIRVRLQKQMARYHTIKKLEREGHSG